MMCYGYLQLGEIPTETVAHLKREMDKILKSLRALAIFSTYSYH